MLAYLRRNQALVTAWLAAALANALLPLDARADEDGVSFWLPGQFGSVAAVPAVPSWQFGTVYYHTSVSADGAVSASRERPSET